ncbi:hypothetical protein LCGC14_1153570 [marine sediment metagenome]|uniref:Replication protein n=1 Tax=marine sediment metagenome TaxID=412755 RepID=A0A0F9Q097_9ZZZZ
MVLAVPLVHTEETPVVRRLAQSYQDHRANFDAQAWRDSGELYYRVDSVLETKYLEKWNHCRDYAWFVRHKDSGEVKVFSSACRLRWCSLCSAARRGWITHQVAEWIKEAHYPKFLTLTLKHSNAPLVHQVKSLYDYFRKFRQCAPMKKGAKGGIWFFQLKRSKESGQWHPHIHCVVEGAYMPQKLLSKVWERITLGSKIVHIKPIRDFEKSAKEVARYASSPADLTTNAKSDYVEIFEAMNHRRSCGTWGTARTVSLRQPKAEETDKWENIGSWTIMYASQNRDPAAAMIINAWNSGDSLADGVTMSVDRSLLWEEGISQILERPPPFLPGFYKDYGF